MASLFTPPFLDVGSGLSPADGAKLLFKVVGSETDKDTFTTSVGDIAHSNPVIADAKGVFPAIYLVGNYDWRLQNKNSVQKNAGDVSEVLTGDGSIFAKVADLAASSGSSLIGYIEGSTNTVATTAQAALRRQVWVEDFGVDGTASAADFTAWTNAINHAKSNNVELNCVSGKTYLFDPASNPGPNNGLTCALLTGESLFINGNNCEWKFKDGGVNGQFLHAILIVMRTLFGSTSQLADYLCIKNITANGNRTNNTPPSPGDYEQSAFFKVQVLRNEGNELKDVYFHNIRQVDPIADTILIGPSEAVSSGEAGILNATVDKFHAGARNGTRSAVICGSGVSRVNLTNFTVDEIPGSEKNSIETEFTSIGTQNFELNMSDIHIDDIELGGILGSEDQIQVNMVNVTTDITGFFLPVRCNVKASNCSLTVGIVNNWRMPRFEASGCTFKHLVFDDGGTQDVRTIANLTETSSTDWQFDNCKFLVEGTPDGGANNYVLDTGNISGSSEDFQFKFNNCTFDPAFPGTIDSFSGGTVVTSDCKLAGTAQAVISGSFSTFHGSYRSYNDDWSAITGTTFEANASVVPTGSIEIVGGKWATFNYTTGSSNWPALLSLGGRRRQVTSFVAGGGIIGDVETFTAAAYAAASGGAAIERKCVDSSPTAAVWKTTLTK